MKVCLVCSHGGHLTETIQLLPAFEDHDIFFVTYHSARDGDVAPLARTYFTRNIGTNFFLFVYTFFLGLYILLKERPRAIVSLGAEIAVPFLYLGKLLGIKTIFIESWCRVKNLSLTGKLVYPVVDAFWIQWPQMLSVCGPKARYRGAVI